MDLILLDTYSLKSFYYFISISSYITVSKYYRDGIKIIPNLHTREAREFKYLV